MGFAINNHHLSGDQVQQVACTGKDSGLFAPGLPDTLVIHFTAGSSLESSVEHLLDKEIKASAHVVIGRDGEVRQLIGFDHVAWHAGTSEWKGRNGLNRYSIGIELDNAGRMSKAGAAFVSWFGRQYPADQVIEAKHRNESSNAFWHVYTEAQLTACFALCRCLKASYPITTILGHEEISPGRKFDPGPAFPLDRLRDQLLVGRADTPIISAAAPGTGVREKAVVITSLLNVRKLPYAGAALASEPLPGGTEVEVVERAGNWCRIKAEGPAWVFGDYLKLEK